MTRSLAKEFGARGILVNAIAPGFIETDMTAEIPEERRTAMLDAVSLGRMGTADEVAGCVLYLSGELASYVTGQTLVVDGGMRL